MLDHINPDFICAGDVVSHIGVSRYAEVFRQDLVKVLKERKDTYFVTSASFGYLLILNHPEIEEKVILIKQSVHNPNYDLHRLFALPYLASTLNIHMLPLAGTFVDKIFIIGCDGKSANKDNEDFWAHAQKAQYHDLVDTGHKCHPTFDVHRQKSTYDRFINSTEESIRAGESLHGKQYVTLQRSNIPVLSGRKISTEWLNEQPVGQPVPLRNYSFTEVSPSSATPVESTESLPIKVGLDCSIEEGDTLRVRGWVLSLPVVDSVRITVNDVEVGYAIKQARPDVLRANPGYYDSSAGFLFLMGLEGQKHCSVVIDFIIENDVVHTMRKHLG
ncbi:hypothetical protein BVX94_03855 [bacterium B17]|nr:hypothetical protein BVX94_03855 [bacterium B17]